jgi:hypothetical protein
MRNMRTATAMKVFLAAWLSGSCGGDDLDSSREPPDTTVFGDGGALVGDGGVEGVCPSTPPKIGERCGGDFSESTMCELATGTCQAGNGNTYTETSVFCCPDGFWDVCSRRSPCEEFPILDAAPGTPAPDAGAARDLPASTPDAGADAPPDVAMSLPPDVAPDAEPDLAPDLAADTSPDLEPDAGVDASPDAEPDAGIDASADV